MFFIINKLYHKLEIITNYRRKTLTILPQDENYRQYWTRVHANANANILST